MVEESICNECGTESRITNQRFKEYEEKIEKFTNMIYHAECGRLPNNWIQSGRKILNL